MEQKRLFDSGLFAEKIEKLESQLKGDNIADEYIGVRLYLYKRKKEKLEKQK